MNLNEFKAAARVVLLSDSPQRPPCFDSRWQWVSWLLSAFDASNGDPRDPACPVRRSARPSFNPMLSYCEDCTDEYEARMRAENRCRPLFVRHALLGDEMET